MAEAKKAESVDASEAPKKKGKLLLFIIIGVLVLVLGGGGAFMLLKKKPADEEDTGDEETSAKAHKPAAKKGKKDAHADVPPVFIKLDAFTVKLQTEGGESYLQTTPELRVLDLHTGDKIKAYTPEIRHRILLVLSSKKSEDLNTPQGIQRLANEIRVAINAIVDGPKEKGKAGEKAEISDEADPDDTVRSVVFTSFVIQ